MGEHAKLSPSAAKRWKECPASVREAESAVQSDTEHSLRGTACHWAYAEWLTSGDAPALGARAPNGVEVDQELLEIAGSAVGWVRAYMKEAGKVSLLVEERVQIGAYYGLAPDLMWGTADTIVLAQRELVVLDLKAGYRDVQAEGNWQLVCYAVGVCEELGWMWETIRLVIVQPRQGEPKEWVVTRQELQQHAEELREPAANALSPSPRYKVNDECRYCPAAARCAALHEESVALARREFEDPAELVRRITVEQMVEILAKRDVIRGVLAAVEEHALKLVLLGQPLPGWKAVEGRKNRVWRPGTEEQVAALLGERAYVRKLVTPAQAEKLADVGQYVEKPRGEPKLVPESDKRTALPPQFEPLDVADLLS